MNDSNLNVCLAPLRIFWGDKKKNIDLLPELFKHVHPETDILILPELFSTGFPSDKDKETFISLAEKNTGETIDFLKKLSSTHNLAIAGSFLANSGGLLYNRAFFIEPSGDEYFADKRHLFALGGEDLLLRPGDSRLKVRFRGWNISMVICYDIRFPAWCRNVDKEYDLLIAVANWPSSRIETWDSLLKARAIENLAYVSGVNCLGRDHTGAEYNGASKIFDFRGKDISVRVENQDLIYASLSMQKLNAYREKFPFWKDADSFTIDI